MQQKEDIEVDDIIKEIDNGEIRSVDDIQQVLILHHPCDKVVLKVLRSGRLISREVMLSDIPG